jgi:chromosome segregation ATPase
MAYLKKNVNMLLLLLIVAVLGSLIGLTAYYQSSYSNISVSYGETIEQVNLLTKNLTLNRMALNNTLSELKIKSEDKSRLDRLYGELSSENEQLTQDLSNALQELSRTKADLATAQRNLFLAQEEITRKTNAIENYKKKVDELEEEISDLRSTICQLNASVC